MNEQLASYGEAHLHLARRGELLDDSEAEGRVLNAIADVELTTGPIGLCWQREIGLDRRRGRRGGFAAAGWTGSRGSRRSAGWLRRLEAMLASALPALHFDDFVADLGDHDVPDIATFAAERFNISADRNSHTASSRDV